MNVRITKKFTFEAGHALYNYDGKCKNLHGHSYQLYVTVIGTPITDTTNPKCGMVLDFGDLKQIVQREIIEVFDHAIAFNAHTPHAALADELIAQGHRVIKLPYQPTSENMVVDFAMRIQKQLPPHVKVHTVRLHETENSYAEWNLADNTPLFGLITTTLADKKGIIFDLDGVLVDTAKYHYLAWKVIAAEFNFNLTPTLNEQLKGVGREDSLRKILQWAEHSLSAEDFESTATRKNELYLQHINHIGEAELLSGVKNFLQVLKAEGKKIALGSASKNARLVLERTGIFPYFDVIVDGTIVSKPKPHPEVFLRAAEGLALKPEECCVFEDAPAGVQAAKAAAMAVIGVGSKHSLPEADVVIEGF